jgi:hypothetical protein
MCPAAPDPALIRASISSGARSSSGSVRLALVMADGRVEYHVESDTGAV